VRGGEKGMTSDGTRNLGVGVTLDQKGEKSQSVIEKKGEKKEGARWFETACQGHGTLGLVLCVMSQNRDPFFPGGGEGGKLIYR